MFDLVKMWQVIVRKKIKINSGKYISICVDFVLYSGALCWEHINIIDETFEMKIDLLVFFFASAFYLSLKINNFYREFLSTYKPSVTFSLDCRVITHKILLFCFRWRTYFYKVISMKKTIDWLSLPSLSLLRKKPFDLLTLQKLQK